MASTMNQQFKITKFAKDLGMKSKDLVEMLAKNGIEAKTTQKALEPLEFDILFEDLTQANQISDIGSYLDGVTYIPSKVKKATKAAKTSEEKKAEEAPAPKGTDETARESAPAEEKKPPVTEKVMEAQTPAPVKAEEKKETARPQNAAAPKEAEKEAAQKNAKAESAPEKAAPAARPAARQPYTGNPYRPQQNGLPGNYGMQQSAGARPQGAGAPARPAAPSGFGAGRRPDAP
ncbi:MAG: translation initiation factor IF-2 N-terminal domain-containing protein, partial [Clostridia bacterium]|nr:translation initiation factor IF-2 N-terminal domain-containing protein [Clostridia bacterium]